jgi:hypothetical protein
VHGANRLGTNYWLIFVLGGVRLCHRYASKRNGSICVATGGSHQFDSGGAALSPGRRAERSARYELMMDNVGCSTDRLREAVTRSQPSKSVPSHISHGHKR